MEFEFDTVVGAIAVALVVLLGAYSIFRAEKK